jgi:anti-sigma regulatory factor (Ser/Thr protein kinase)
VCKQTSQVLNGDLKAPGHARRAVAAWLSPLVPAGAAEDTSADLLLVLTELITNAVQAGASTVTIAVTVHSDVLLLGVSDRAAGWPQLQVAPPTQDHGRGLALVDTLCSAWGVTPSDGGKTVWTELALVGDVTSIGTCSHV